MPSRNCTSTLAPLASGVPRVMVPALILLLKPPPFGCEGGCSSVVPFTVTEQGVAWPAAVHVTESLIPATTTELDVRGRRSAIPEGAGNVVRSTTRKRKRVILAPVEFTNLRRMLNVPNVELLGGSDVKSRTRLGGELDAAVASSKT